MLTRVQCLRKFLRAFRTQTRFCVQAACQSDIFIKYNGFLSGTSCSTYMVTDLHTCYDSEVPVRKYVVHVLALVRTHVSLSQEAITAI